MPLRRAAVTAALLAPAVLFAQPGGPYVPLILSLPASARILALGNMGVAGRDDDVLFYNPAQLVIARGTSGSFERYSASSSGGAMSSVTRFSNSAIAIVVHIADYKTPVSAIAPASPGFAPTPIVAFPLTRESSVGPGLGEGFTSEATFGYALTLKGFRWGAAAKYWEDEVPAIRVQRGAFDLGAAKDFMRFYTVALAVQNIGPSTEISCITHAEFGHEPCQVEAMPATPSSLRVLLHQPTRTTLGGAFSHQLGELDLVATAGASILRTNAVYPAGGVELGYSWLDGYNVALRAGARRPLPGESGFTAGGGFTADRLSIDYALELLAGSRVANRIGLRIR